MLLNMFCRCGNGCDNQTRCFGTPLVPEIVVRESCFQELALNVAVLSHCVCCYLGHEQHMLFCSGLSQGVFDQLSSEFEQFDAFYLNLSRNLRLAIGIHWVKFHKEINTLNVHSSQLALQSQRTSQSFPIGGYRRSF